MNAAASARLRRARALLASISTAGLVALMAVLTWHDLAGKSSIDFYNPWAVAAAHASLGGDPYSGADAYSRFADQLADRSGSARLRETNGQRRLIDPTATPLYYLAFGWLPRDYDLAYGIVAALLVAALLVAVATLGRMRGVTAPATYALGAMTALLFLPFEVDVRVGNVNTLQLAAIAAFVSLAPRDRARRAGWAHELYLPALALFVALKPDTLLVAALLAVHFAFVRGARDAVRGGMLAVATLVTAYATSALYFGSAGVWHAWYGSLQDPAGGTLLYAVHYGNASIAKLVSERWSGIGPYTAGMLLGAALAFFAGYALRGEDASATRQRLHAALSDPLAMASLGVLFTFAMSPLVWPHYEVLALVPVFHLFRRAGRWDAASACVALTCVLLSRPLAAAFGAAGAPAAIFTALTFGWVPLVPAACLALARPAR